MIKHQFSILIGVLSVFLVLGSVAFGSVSEAGGVVLSNTATNQTNTTPFNPYEEDDASRTQQEQARKAQFESRLHSKKRRPGQPGAYGAEGNRNKRPSSQSHSFSTVDINLGGFPPATMGLDRSGKVPTYFTPKCNYGSDYIFGSRQIYNCTCPQSTYCSYTNIVPVSDELDQSCWFPLATAQFVDTFGMCNRMPSLKKFKRQGNLPLRMIFYNGNYFLDFGCTKFVSLKKTFFVDLESCTNEIPFPIEKGPPNFQKKSEGKETSKISKVVSLSRPISTISPDIQKPERVKKLVKKNKIKKVKKSKRKL